MTNRLYYNDAYLWSFDGVVVAEKEDRGNWIALNQSAFYPTSGGQPFDIGTLSYESKQVQVKNVEADRDGTVWHLVSQSIPVGVRVHGEIDSDRRLDHMEQHGGEHMLAGAVWEKLRGVTIGLHLGTDDSTIDIELPDGRIHLTDEEIEMLEETVNTRIRLDAPIRCWFPSPEELKTLPLRKEPTVKDHIRIVAMGSFEMVACGGTHPSSTGRIGQLKILSAVPSKGKVRLSFVCGRRAELFFRNCFRSARKAGNVLSCPVEKLASSAGELKARLAEATRRLNEYETMKILEEIEKNEDRESLKGITISVTQLESGETKPVAEAVNRYLREDGKILLLCAGERLTFARSRDVDLDMNVLIKRVGRGGGRPEISGGQGIPQCVEVARKILITEGKNKQWR